MDRDQIVKFNREFLLDYPCGHLTKKEFCQLFRNKLITDQDDERRIKKLKKFAGHVFNSLDRNANKWISFNDFLVFYSIISFGNLRDKIELAFRIYDQNGNNVIGRNEMRRMLEILFDLTMIGESDGKKKTARQTVKVIMKKLDKLDTNRDKLIQFDEFMNGCIEDKFVCSILVDLLFNT